MPSRTPKARTNHFTFISINSTTELRTSLQLSLNLLDLHPSLITKFLIPEYALPKYRVEYNLQPLSLIDRVKDRFRLKAVKTDSTKPDLGQESVEGCSTERIGGS